MAQFPQRVQLGRTGVSVGPLAVSGGYGVDEKSLLRAFDRGVNYWYHGNPDFNLCMTGPRNAAQMAEALAALDEGPLFAEENERVRRLGKHVYDHAMRKG